jgi:F-type H+-transporting ATPase subunit delta
LELLVKHSREEDLQGILQNYNSLYFAERNVVRARITAASPLDADQVARLLALLKTPESSDVQLEQVVDESLIGGFVLRVADQQVDASVATALATLDREFQKNLYIADF